MQKVLFGIFAHPDDEAFGPCGTLVLETRAGTELHLISLTAGEAGMNPDGHDNLADVRLQEWQKAGSLMGATSMHHLGYQDGTLCNMDHLAITDKIMDIVRSTVKDRSDLDIEFMSIDLNGVTGHIDHIVAARSACQAFCRLKETGLPMRRIRLACVPRTQFESHDCSFVFREAGRTANEIDEVVDARQVLDRVHQIMSCHHTQRSDARAQIGLLGDGVAVDHFIVQEF